MPAGAWGGYKERLTCWGRNINRHSLNTQWRAHEINYNRNFRSRFWVRNVERKLNCSYHKSTSWKLRSHEKSRARFCYLSLSDQVDCFDTSEWEGRKSMQENEENLCISRWSLKKSWEKFWWIFMSLSD